MTVNQLERNDVELSAVTFIRRAAVIRPDAVAVVDDASVVCRSMIVVYRWAGALRDLGGAYGRPCRHPEPGMIF